MTHLHEDQLLLFAYGELPEMEAAEAERHLAGCPACRAQLERIDRARVALDWAAPPQSRRSGRWIAAALATAALLAAVLLTRPGPNPGTGAERAWPPPSDWSANAGYIAGGAQVLQIDAQLTRLEQERYYGLPD